MSEVHIDEDKCPNCGNSIGLEYVDVNGFGTLLKCPACGDEFPMAEAGEPDEDEYLDYEPEPDYGGEKISLDKDS